MLTRLRNSEEVSVAGGERGIGGAVRSQESRGQIMLVAVRVGCAQD